MHNRTQCCVAYTTAIKHCLIIIMLHNTMLYQTDRPYYLQDLRNAVVPLANTMAIEVRGNINGEKLTAAPEPLFTLGVSLTVATTLAQVLHSICIL
jgi:hypothetical protein